MNSTMSPAQRAEHMIRTKNCREQAAVIPQSLLYDLYFSQTTAVKIQILEDAIDFYHTQIDWSEPFSDAIPTEDERVFRMKEDTKFNALVSKLHRATLQLANLRAEALQPER
jgi:hypothetical protein